MTRYMLTRRSFVAAVATLAATPRLARAVDPVAAPRFKI
jgi:hypothetical protein